MILLLLKILQTWHADRKIQIEQLSFWSNIQISLDFELQNSEANPLWNLFEFQRGSNLPKKNLINSIKFYIHMIFQNINFYWLTCIVEIGVPSQVVNMT
jgi:hypothetical protein